MACLQGCLSRCTISRKGPPHLIWPRGYEQSENWCGSARAASSTSSSCKANTSVRVEAGSAIERGLVVSKLVVFLQHNPVIPAQVGGPLRVRLRYPVAVQTKVKFRVTSLSGSISAYIL